MEHHPLNLRWKWIKSSNKNNSNRLKDIGLIADQAHYWVYLFLFAIRLMKIQENNYFIINICFINIIVLLFVSVPFVYLNFLFLKKPTITPQKCLLPWKKISLIWNHPAFFQKYPLKNGISVKLQFNCY